MKNFFEILGIEDWRDVMTRDELLERLRSHSPETHYVYVIWRTDKNKSEPMYVGKGKGRRVFCHLYKSDRRNHIKSAILERMRIKGSDPLFSLIGTEMSDEDAITLEMATISKLGRISSRNGPLANLTEGGEGRASTRASGVHHGRARAVYVEGVRYELLSDAAAALGIYASAIHKRINSGWDGYYYEDVGQIFRTRPKKHSRDHIATMRQKLENKKKPVYVFGVRYPSMSAAAKSLNVSYATIRKRCCGGHSGYEFSN